MIRPRKSGGPSGDLAADLLAGRAQRTGTLVHPGWGNATPVALAPMPLSRASTVQVLGVFSILLLPVVGVGLILAVVALAMAGSVRRELAAAGGRGPGGREVTVGVACARASLCLGGLFVLSWVLLAAFA